MLSRLARAARSVVSNIPGLRASFSSPSTVSSFPLTHAAPLLRSGCCAAGAARGHHGVGITLPGQLVRTHAISTSPRRQQIEFVTSADELEQIMAKCSDTACTYPGSPMTTVLAFVDSETAFPTGKALGKVLHEHPGVHFLLVDINGSHGLSDVARRSIVESVALPAFRVIRGGVDQPLVQANIAELQRLLSQLKTSD